LNHIYDDELTGKLIQLLEEYKIEIPIIQRDYAQGREEKSEFRDDFLNTLSGIVDNKKVENEARQKEVALQKEYVALQAKGDKLTDAEKKAFEKKSQDFQSFLNSSQDKLNKEQMAKLKKIEDIYVKAVKKVAAEGKYDYIFEAEALKVGGEDITDRVIKEMEALK